MSNDLDPTIYKGLSQPEDAVQKMEQMAKTQQALKLLGAGSPYGQAPSTQPETV